MRAGMLVFAVAFGLYLPTARHGFVQDDWAIVALNPAAHSLPAAIRAVPDPYWPPPSQAGLWRPLTIVSFAVDWTVAGGRPGWLHVANALWHALASVLVLALFARWLPSRAAAAAALVFAAHPVHVEAAASLVGRAELVVAVAVLGATLAIRAGRWTTALLLAAAAMLGKEHGVVVGVVLLLYWWLDDDTPAPSRATLLSLGVLTIAYLVSWRFIGGSAGADVAAPFFGASIRERLAIALPAIWRAATILVWPAELSVDYGPQVIPAARGWTVASLGGVGAIAAVIAIAWFCRRRAPQLAWASGVAALSYLPTSNLLFPSGVVLAERNLYLAVLLPAALVGTAAARVRGANGRPAALAVTALVVGALALRSVARLPAWQSNRAHLLTLLTEHPESARAQAWAAGVYGAIGDTAGARAAYARSLALFDRDPHVLGSAAFFSLEHHDTTAAAELARRARAIRPRELDAIRVQLQLARAAGDTVLAAALADSAQFWLRPVPRSYRSPDQ